MYTCIHTCIHLPHRQLFSLPPSWTLRAANGPLVREMGGAPRNLAPRSRFLVWIVEPSGCHCTGACGGNTHRRAPTPRRSTSPFSDTSRSHRLCNTLYYNIVYYTII